MSIADMPVFSMLRTRMQWHQERQRLLAENVANADTPDFRPRDLAQPDFTNTAPRATQVSLTKTHTGHIAGSVASGGSDRFERDRTGSFTIRPAGNAVSLEDEMLKVASNAMDYQAAASLYSRSLGLIKLALARR